MLAGNLSTRSRELAARSRIEYQSDHGKQPDAEDGSRAEIDGYFTADFRTLRQEGAGQGDRAACRAIWEEAFFQLVPAGGIEGVM